MANLPATPDRKRRELAIQLRIWRIGHFFNAGGLPEWVKSTTEEEPPHQPESSDQSEIWLARCEALTIRGYVVKAARLIDFLIPFARIARNNYLLARVLTVAGIVRTLRGEYRSALQLLNEAVPLYGDLLDDTLAASVHITLPSVLATVGDVEQGVVHAAEFCRRARESGNPALLAVALSTQALVGCMHGAWVDAARAGWDSIQSARKAGHRYYEYIATVYHGYAVGQLGDVEHGLRLLHESVQMAMRLKTQLPLGRNFAWIGELYLLAGDADRAEKAVNRSIRLSRASGYTVGIPLAEKVLAQVRLAQGRTAEAVLLAGQALSTFRGMEAMTEVARCHALLARAQSGEEGRAHHETALLLFDQYGMSAERQELERELYAPI